MIIAVAAFVLCTCFTIRSSAQSLSALLQDVETRGTKPYDASPEISASNQIKLIDGGILNLDAALSAVLRETQVGEARPPDPDLFSTSTTDSGGAGGKSSSKSEPGDPPDLIQPLPDHTLDQYMRERQKRTSFDWASAFKQSMLFLGIQHAFRLLKEPDTREDLKGPFFRDYINTLKSLRGWDDGDPFIVNYIGHPMMGSVTGFIQVQNDPKGIGEEVSWKKSYWRSRLKAFSFSIVYSTQFELGLFSEASIGNIGMRPTYKSRHPMGYVDLVVTPVLGAGWLVGEDMLDRYLIRRLESNIPNRTAQIVIRGFLNPTRSFANMMRGKWPWHRDDRN
jgi:hypothetical protein